MPKTNPKLTLILPAIIACAFFALAGKAEAAEYYARPTGSGTTCSLASPCSLSTMNTKLQVGDTGYLRGGTYAQQIAPANNGTGENARIIYAAYTEETVYITYASGSQASLGSKQYITIDGLNFRNASSYWVYAKDSVGITIRNCTFVNALGYQGISLWGASYARLQSNTLSAGECGGPTNPIDYCPGDLVSWYGGGGTAHHNMVDGNTFNKTVHFGINGGGSWNIIRNNVFSNEWHGNISIQNMPSSTNLNLIEDNIIKNAGEDTANNPNPPSASDDRNDGNGVHIYLGGNRTIIRNNIFYNNGSNSYGASDGWTVNDNRTYNNTFDAEYRAIMSIPSSVLGEIDRNVFKNNAISYSVEDYNVYWLANSDDTNTFINNNLYGSNSRFRSTTESASTIQAAYSSEWSGNTANNPLFTNRSLNDYSLTSASPLIDAGAFLTTVTTATGNGTSFTVADAGYFCDGWGIVTGDIIKLANGQERTITAINYSTNQITVNSSVSWTQGMGVALDYEGARPDIGAKEYGGGGTDTTAPGSPSGLMVR